MENLEYGVWSVDAVACSPRRGSVGASSHLH